MEAPDGTVPDPPGRRERVLVGALVLLAVALRAAYVLALRDHPLFDVPVMDPGFHWQWALAWARGEELLDGPFFRAPLYPLFLGSLVELFGPSTLAPRLVQSLLGGLAVLLAWRLGRRAVGPVAGVGGAAIVAVSWVLIAFDAELLIPTLYVPLLLLALERTVAFADAPTARRAAVAGACFGLAAIARPNVLLLMPVLFFWAWGRARATGGRGAAAALALTAGTLLPIAPVTLHNVAEGDPVLVASQGGVNFFIGNNHRSDGSTAIVPGTRGGWWEGYHDAIALAERAEGRELSPSEVSRHYFERGLSWIAVHPVLALRHFAWKARLLVSDVELGNNQEIRFTAFRFAPWLAASPVRFDWLFALGVVGLACAARRGGARVVPLWAFALVYALTIVLFFVNARFRLPLLPVLAIGAAHALELAWGAWRARRFRPLAIGAAVAAALYVASNVVPGGVRPQRSNGLLHLAKGELARGDVDAAVPLLEEALGADPGNVYARTALADAVRRRGDTDRAIRLLEETIELPGGRGELPEVRAQLADVLVDAGRAHDARALAEMWLLTERDQPALLFAQARAHAALGALGPARRSLERALEVEPTNFVAARALAQLAEVDQAPDAVIDAWRRAVDLAPFAPGEASRAAAERLAALLEAAGREDEAAEVRRRLR